MSECTCAAKDMTFGRCCKARETTDRELLEGAAKAEGRTLKYMTQHIEGKEPEEFIACWNPLTDDGDALRLMVKLRLEMTWWKNGVRAESANHEPVGIQPFDGDPAEATRRAIVRAAYEIGKAT